MIDVILVTCRTVTLNRSDENTQLGAVLSTIDMIEAVTPEPHNLIATCQNASASVNRNYGLSKSTSEIVVMLDDDIIGFYRGWLSDLIAPLQDNAVVLVSARLTNETGKPAPMMGGFVPFDNGIYDINVSGYRGYRRVTTAAISFRNNGIRFDEGFIGSGYEDTAFMNQLNERNPDKRFLITNRCKLIHLNKEKNQGGKYFECNKTHYLSLYPDDESVRCQNDWTRRKGV